MALREASRQPSQADDPASYTIMEHATTSGQNDGVIGIAGVMIGRDLPIIGAVTPGR
jgi:hypothetical protein